MKDEQFTELLESVREGQAILRGEQSPSRTFIVPRLDVKRIREAFDFPQKDFALILGVSLRTLQSWEQGLRVPRGPANLLLRVIAQRPQVVRDVLFHP